MPSPEGNISYRRIPPRSVLLQYSGLSTRFQYPLLSTLSAPENRNSQTHQPLQSSRLRNRAIKPFLYFLSLNLPFVEKFWSLQQFYKIVKYEFRIKRTAARFRVELSGKERFGFVADTLVGSIIHIHKQRFPISAKSFVVYSKAMVLRRDEATVGAHLTHRLIMAAVAILQLVGLCASRLRQQLVAHADSANRLVAGRAFFIFSTVSPAMSGSPGPLEINNPS